MREEEYKMKKNKMPTGSFPMDLTNGKGNTGRFSAPAKRGGKKNKLPSGTFPMNLTTRVERGRFTP